MIRNSAKMTALAAVALLGSVTAFNCSKNGTGSSDDVGHVNLSLMLTNSNINKVHYVIHAGAPTTITDVAGDINVSDPNATATAFVSFKASTGDIVTLSADTTATPAIHCTGVSMPFSVIAGQEALANVVLLCGGGQLAGVDGVGNVHIIGTVSEQPGSGDNCPQLESWTVSPLQTSFPGGTIDVAASASDMDAGDTLAYAWGPAAKFTAPTAQMTQYHCTAPGADTITLVVSDNHTPSNCSETITFAVNCVDASGSAGATGTAGAGTAGATGTAGAGSAGATGTAGAGTAGAGPSACTTCEQTNTLAGNCFNTATPTSDPSNIAQFGCSGFTGAAQQACLNLLACLEGASCKTAIGAASADYGESQVGNDDPLPCLCGSITKGTCLGAVGAGEAGLAGVCAAQYRAAAASVSTTCATSAAGTVGCVSVLQSTYDPATPLGVASNLLTCNVDSPCTCP